MGNFVAIHLLKGYNPGTFNRGENGEAKQIYVGGVNRARFSSQCQKRAIREIMTCDEIRSSHIENLISACLDVKVNDGTITEEEKDLIGGLICNKDIIGVDEHQWDAFMGRKDSKGKDFKFNRVVVTTNASEINALINTFIDYYKENGKDALVKSYKTVATNTALNDVNISVAKALFGTMATDGVLGTVDGALQMGQAYSVDAFRPEPDFFSVKFVGRSGATPDDPFFGAYTDFADTESRKASGETINAGLALNSSLMYSYANINIKELERNLNTFVGTRKYEDKDIKDLVTKTITDFVQAMIKMTPEATQNRSASYVEPTMVLVEVIENDTNLQPDWSKCLYLDEKSIAEQAIEKMSAFANSKTFRTGNITQFVMFGSDYSDFADKFDASNITTMNELTTSIKEAVMPLI